MRRIVIAVPLALGVLAFGAGCNGKPESEGAPPAVTTVVSPSAAPSASVPPTPGTKVKSPPPPSWPTPEDCISYDPSKAAVRFDAPSGAFVVEAASVVVMRLYGTENSDLGQKGLALAKRYRKHCFLGRTNTREEKANYSFDYWRNQVSGAKSVPGQDEDCSAYDKTNLTVEDMGGGDGWRVKDHDHVLHLFDNESDARNGKLVLSKYSRICLLGDSGDGTIDQISYQS